MDNPSALDHLQDKADSPHVSGNEAETVSLTPVESFSLISISHSLYENRLPPDFFNPIVRDVLLFYAEQGDVQMAVSVLIVLGDRIRKEIDEQTQVEHCKEEGLPRERFLQLSCCHTPCSKQGLGNLPITSCVYTESFIPESFANSPSKIQGSLTY